jgi:glutathione S-transferase
LIGYREQLLLRPGNIVQGSTWPPRNQPNPMSPFNSSRSFRFLAPEGEKQNWGTRAAEQMFFNRLTLVSRQLARASMMAGNEFTAADISIIYALGMAERLGLAERFGPEIADYRSRMSARPATGWR